jgi:CheY-like chemotaxis protein
MNTPDAAAGPSAPAGREVLVVDDHALSRKHLCTVLGFHGWTVRACDSAAAARPALLERTPDIVLLDLQMPGEDGYALLAWMRTQAPLARVPAICVTASVPPDERERVRAAGFAAFVPKPITPPQRLLEAMARALGEGGAP